MKIYRIEFNYDYSLADVVEEKNNADSLEISTNNVEYLKNFNLDWLKDESTIIPNLVIIMSQVLACDKKAVNVLKGVLPEYAFTPILVGDICYYAISKIKVEEGLNKKASKIVYFSTGDIMDVEIPVLQPLDYPPLFKVEEMDMSFFCTEQLKEAVEKSFLTGWKFTECKVKSKSWFNF